MSVAPSERGISLRRLVLSESEPMSISHPPVIIEIRTPDGESRFFEWAVNMPEMDLLRDRARLEELVAEPMKRLFEVDVTFGPAIEGPASIHGGFPVLREKGVGVYVDVNRPPRMVGFGEMIHGAGRTIVEAQK